MLIVICGERGKKDLARHYLNKRNLKFKEVNTWSDVELEEVTNVLLSFCSPGSINFEELQKFSDDKNRKIVITIRDIPENYFSRCEGASEGAIRELLKKSTILNTKDFVISPDGIYKIPNFL